MTRAATIAFVLALGAVAPVVGPARPAACAPGNPTVAVVVDPGDQGPTTTVCVPEESSDTGASVLAARARLLGRPAPRYASSGLLCAIDGFPNEGCGTRGGSRYAYWAYYLGDREGWSYANGGPAGRRARSDTTEGWRWHEAGTGNGADPAPRAASDPLVTCRPEAPSTTSTTPTTLVPLPGPSGPGPSGQSGPAGPPTADQPDQSSVANPEPQPSASLPVSTTATTSPADSVPVARTVAPIAAMDAPGADGGPPLRSVVGIGVVAVLAAAGFVVARRRRP